MKWPFCPPSREDEGRDRRPTATIKAVTNPLDEVTDPAYLADVATADIDVVRSKRRECQDLENGLSYVRRLLHGRLDIVRGELEQRRSGAAPAGLDDIIARLPELLADGSRSDALPRPPQDLAPDAHAEQLVARLETQFPASVLGELPNRSMDELAQLSNGLSAFEREVSSGRNTLHGVIDQLQNEIVRRYQAGDASVDSLLP
jgi:hypothetical protein